MKRIKLSNTPSAMAKGAREGGDPGVGGPTLKDDVATTSKTSEEPPNNVSPTPKAAVIPLQQEKDVEKTDVHPPRSW